MFQIAIGRILNLALRNYAPAKQCARGRARAGGATWRRARGRRRDTGPERGDTGPERRPTARRAATHLAEPEIDTRRCATPAPRPIIIRRLNQGPRAQQSAPI